jgi:CDGSH-type Zn-finger protein
VRTKSHVVLAGLQATVKQREGAPLFIGGLDTGYRPTLCRCGASPNKAFCESRHKAADSVASGEPELVSGNTIPTRDATHARIGLKR